MMDQVLFMAAATLALALVEIRYLRRRVARLRVGSDGADKHENGLDSLTIEQLRTVKDEIVALGTGGNNYVPTEGGSLLWITRDDNGSR